MGYLELLKDGPLVVEVPAGLQGMFDDFFQRPLIGPAIDGRAWEGDVGFAAPDKGTTASGLDNGQPFPSLNQMDEPVQNADGSMELHSGPIARTGKEKELLRTVPGKGYFVIFRLYLPEGLLRSVSEALRPREDERIMTPGRD